MDVDALADCGASKKEATSNKHRKNNRTLLNRVVFGTSDLSNISRLPFIWYYVKSLVISWEYKIIYLLSQSIYWN
jgi:hypothetical protein